MVKSGSAHHTRCVMREETGGGGGGRGTLESAVMLSSLVVASMTVTEVTTRITVVGVVALAALFLVGRSGFIDLGNGRSSQSGSGRFVYRATTYGTAENPSRATPTPRSAAAKWLAARPSTKAARIVSLGVVAVVGGAALGIGASLLLVVALNATSNGAG